MKNRRIIIAYLISLLIGVTPYSFAQVNTVEAITNHGTFHYQIDNSGKVNVSGDLQAVFDELSVLENVSATISFSPGVYFLDSPVIIKMSSVKLLGHGHGGVDIHGANMKGGSIFLLGKKCAPNGISFEYAGQSEAFPSGEKPWPNKNLKVELENLSFVGYNNTGVNTADGYSRFRNDTPNFRGLQWYPAKDRYENVEKEGQRAIYLPKTPSGDGVAKCELFRATGCYFTDLYVGIDIADCDVSYIDKNWFGQVTYGIRLHGNGQGMMVSNNLFADLETALKLGSPQFSTFSNNTFAYVSKCFEIERIRNSTISGNAVYNWERSTGAAAFGAFIYAASSNNLNVTGNSIGHYPDSRKKTITTDSLPNGQSFIQFDNAYQLNFSNNIIDTKLSQTVLRLHDCTNCVVVDNIIKHGVKGNAVAQTGECLDNYYRPIKIEESESFDVFKY